MTKKKSLMGPRMPAISAVEILPGGSMRGDLSPESSSVASRQMEKEQLSNLNDRLASYIERVRSLEWDNQRLNGKLIAMRAEFDAKLNEKEEELAGLYEEKQRNDSGEIQKLEEKVHELKSTNARLVNDYKEMLDMNAKLQKMRAEFDAKMSESREELKALYEDKQKQDAAEIQKLEKTVHELKCANAKLVNDCKDMDDMKIKLDTELQAYQQLLEGEEYRLNITPKESSVLSTSSRASVASRKRKYADLSVPRQMGEQATSGSNGNVIIDEVDPEGKFIRLKNTAEVAVPIGGWIIRCSDQRKEIIFKFNSRQMMGAGKTITVWSKGVAHEKISPSHTSMREESWLAGDMVQVELFDAVLGVQAWNNVTSTECGPAEAPSGRCNYV